MENKNNQSKDNKGFKSSKDTAIHPMTERVYPDSKQNETREATSKPGASTTDKSVRASNRSDDWEDTERDQDLDDNGSESEEYIADASEAAERFGTREGMGQGTRQARSQTERDGTRMNQQNESKRQKNDGSESNSRS